MTPENFAESNFTYTAPKSMPDCGDLPVQRHGDGILSCWRMTWRERLSALLFGRCWLNLHATAQPPVWLCVSRRIHRLEQDEGRRDGD